MVTGVSNVATGLLKLVWSEDCGMSCLLEACGQSSFWLVWLAKSAIMIKHMKTEMTFVSVKLSKENEEAHDTGLWLLASSGVWCMRRDYLVQNFTQAWDYSGLKLYWRGLP